MKIKTIFLNNSGIKILSLFLAIISWYAVRETISFEVIIPDIPLEIQIAEGWAVLQQSTNVVIVAFRGSQEDIRLLDKKQIKAVVDLRTNSVAGSVDVPVLPRNIHGVRGVRTVRVEPGHIGVIIDHKLETKVPVKSRITGKPFSGEVEAVYCEPAIVLLKGAAQQIRRTDLLYTETINVEGRISSFTKRCRILPPSDSWMVQIEPAEVQATVIITERNETLEWKDVPVSVLVSPGVSFKVEITPARVDVVLTGKEDVLDEMKELKPKVLVDCINLDPSLTYDLPVYIHLPPGKEVSAVTDPLFVHVVLAKP